MAVYERVWRPYAGALTAERWRFLVVTRFAFWNAFASRAFTGFYVLAAMPAVVGLALVYLSHNLEMLKQIAASSELMTQLTMAFFQKLFAWQAIPAFLIAVLVGPGLIAPDLSNGALPLYLCRPISRADYVLGKLAVLVLLLSPVTWIGGLAVYLLQSVLEGGGWWSAHLRIPLAYVVGHGVWILVVSLLSLAVSAWVRIKPLAIAALLGIMMMLAAVGDSMARMTGIEWVGLFDLGDDIVAVVLRLFDPQAVTKVPIAGAWLVLAAVAALSLLILHRKLRAHEVVR
jgi:ABC-type transport system involved in multi-copper enzyme maturation permease subunit